jgi:hypothetical protein|tara:strand:- start:1341 stop:1457 length:117 start_codon:yes stop_codon:yes gene_type:complete
MFTFSNNPTLISLALKDNAKEIINPIKKRFFNFGVNND